MKNYKNKIENYSFYDHTGIEKHLETMAEKGWLLESIHRFTWTFRRISPKKCHFAVTYDPKASEFDPEPQEGQLIYRDYSEHYGWKFICSSNQMQIFCNEAEDPVPLNTDPVIEVEMIHNSAKRSFLRAHWLLLALFILQGINLFSKYWGDSDLFLSDPIMLFAGASLALAIVYLGVELARYYLWHYKAESAAKQGIFLDTPSAALFYQLMLIALGMIMLSFVMRLFLTGERQLLTIIAAYFAGLLTLMAIVNQVREYLKHIKVDKSSNFAVTLIVDILLALVLNIGIVFWLF